MATYKVPQDVEADDKLIGPFSFRQFIYLIIVVMAIAIAWGLAQLFVGLAIIPLPIIIFFGALALPLRKDQPMEIYMAAMVSYYLKPRQRLWDPEGIETLIEITAPKTIEVQRKKDLSQTEAAQRLSYLANIVDTQGWAIRGVSGASGTTINNDVYLEAQSATDVLDTNTSVAHTFDQMMSQSNERMHEEARQRMFQATVAPTPPTPTTSSPVTNQPTVDPLLSQMSQQLGVAQGQANSTAPTPHFNPYPTFHQSVIQPLNDATHQAESDITAEAKPATSAEAMASVTAAYAQKEEKPASTSDSALTAGIMSLANNPDLSIETIAHEAHRLKKKAEAASEDVVISLR
ncbi:MAG: PrgI family protein [Candidatus Saccharimonadaceae bacterium]